MSDSPEKPLAFVAPVPPGAPSLWSERMEAALSGGHDLGLGAWGPFAKDCFGLSHLPGPVGGRVDWIVVPELHRRSLHLPQALKESGYLPWSASPDLASYAYRQTLVGRDEVFAQVAFEAEADGRRRIRIEWHNRTDHPCDVRLHLVARWWPPALGSWRPRFLSTLTAICPVGVAWTDALSYAAADMGSAAGRKGLSYDGARQGQVFESGLVDGQGLRWPEDDRGAAWVEFAVPRGLAAVRFGLRCKLGGAAVAAEFLAQPGGERVSIQVGDGLNEAFELSPGTEGLRLRFPEGAPGLVLDGVWFADAKAGRPDFSELPPSSHAELDEAGGAGFRLRWPEPVGGYELETTERPWVRRYRGELESVLLAGLHDHVKAELAVEGPEHSQDFIFPMRSLAPRSRSVQEFGLRRLGEGVSDTRDALPVAAAASVLAEGEAYRFGIERLAAVVATNVVYPVRTRGQAIRHFTPGRWWDSLYTWDCGCISLGLSEFAPQRAIELLNTYLTSPGDADCAFIHHGSPVPTQFHAFHELWQKSQDRGMLAYFYPRLAQYLRYLAGTDPRSGTRPFQNRLLRTWDLFYNSGGWDDYPAQGLVNADPVLRARTVPMVVSSQVAAAARILAMAATELGEEAEEWRELAAGIGEDLEAHAWDESEGLYGYLVHDAEGRPERLLTDPESGRSANLGLDGLTPLLSGRISTGRRRRLLAALADEARFLTPHGLSTVDRSAPYYRDDGYWNGAVWMPYQYFFWKALLDCGETEAARELAFRVLGLYERETREARGCFEHFMIASGCGAGWHHFGGLSAPLLAVFAAYFVPGRITTGPGAWIVRQEWDESHRQLTCLLRIEPGDKAACLITHEASVRPAVRIDGTDTEAVRPYPGLIEIPLPSGNSIRELRVELG